MYLTFINQRKGYKRKSLRFSGGILQQNCSINSVNVSLDCVFLIGLMDHRFHGYEFILVFKGFKFLSVLIEYGFSTGIGFLITDVNFQIVLNSCTGTFAQFFCGKYHRGFTTYYFY